MDRLADGPQGYFPLDRTPGDQAHDRGWFAGMAAAAANNGFFLQYHDFGLGPCERFADCGGEIEVIRVVRAAEFGRRLCLGMGLED